MTDYTFLPFPLLLCFVPPLLPLYTYSCLPCRCASCLLYCLASVGWSQAPKSQSISWKSPASWHKHTRKGTTMYFMSFLLACPRTAKPSTASPPQINTSTSARWVKWSLSSYSLLVLSVLCVCVCVWEKKRVTQLLSLRVGAGSWRGSTMGRTFKRFCQPCRCWALHLMSRTPYSGYCLLVSNLSACLVLSSLLLL